jgi:hypothetical protein
MQLNLEIRRRFVYTTHGRFPLLKDLGEYPGGSIIHFTKFGDRIDMDQSGVKKYCEDSLGRLRGLLLSQMVDKIQIADHTDIAINLDPKYKDFNNKGWDWRIRDYAPYPVDTGILKDLGSREIHIDAVTTDDKELTDRYVKWGKFLDNPIPEGVTPADVKQARPYLDEAIMKVSNIIKSNEY